MPPPRCTVTEIHVGLSRPQDPLLGRIMASQRCPHSNGQHLSVCPAWLRRIRLQMELSRGAGRHCLVRPELQYGETMFWRCMC